MRGTITALATPFFENGEVNYNALKKNLLFQIENGVDGVAILGSTGEASTLSREEKIRIIQKAKEVINQKIPLMVGTGSHSTQETIEMTNIAFSEGADSVLIVAPYYNKPPQEGLFRHFQMINVKAQGPIVIYNNPSRAGVNIENETMLRLLDLENIKAIKESSGDLTQAAELIIKAKEKRPDIAIFSGDDSAIIPLIALGADGIISVASNIVPRNICQMTSFALKGDFESARILNNHLFPLIKSLFVTTNPIPLKAMMNLLKMEAGPVRPPLSNMPEALLNHVKQELAVYTSST